MQKNLREQIVSIIEEHKSMTAAVEAEKLAAIAAVAEAIVTAIKKGCKVYICGNGGSAADAQHIASELVGRFQRERKALPAIALTTDTSAITSISNDYGYEEIFARQVEALLGEGDIFWAISTSGSSVNVVTAAELAKKKGGLIVAFTGRTDSELEQLADICFCADSKSTARSQEIHQLAYHIICELVEQSFCQEPK